MAGTGKELIIAGRKYATLVGKSEKNTFMFSSMHRIPLKNTHNVTTALAGCPPSTQEVVSKAEKK